MKVIINHIAVTIQHEFAMTSDSSFSRHADLLPNLIRHEIQYLHLLHIVILNLVPNSIRDRFRISLLRVNEMQARMNTTESHYFLNSTRSRLFNDNLGTGN